MSLRDRILNFLDRRIGLQSPPSDGVEKDILRAKIAGISATRQSRAVEKRQTEVDKSVETLKGYNERNNFSAAISAVFAQKR